MLIFVRPDYGGSTLTHPNYASYLFALFHLSVCLGVGMAGGMAMPMAGLAPVMGPIATLAAPSLPVVPPTIIPGLGNLGKSPYGDNKAFRGILQDSPSSTAASQRSAPPPDRLTYSTPRPLLPNRRPLPAQINYPAIVVSD